MVCAQLYAHLYAQLYAQLLPLTICSELLPKGIDYVFFVRTIRSGEKRDVALCKENVSRPEIIPAITGPEIITCLIIFLGSEAGPEIFVAWNYFGARNISGDQKWCPNFGAQIGCPKGAPESAPKIGAPNFSNLCPKSVPQIFPISAPNLCPKSVPQTKCFQFVPQICAPKQIWGTNLGQKLE